MGFRAPAHGAVAFAVVALSRALSGNGLVGIRCNFALPASDAVPASDATPPVACVSTNLLGRAAPQPGTLAVGFRAPEPGAVVVAVVALSRAMSGNGMVGIRCNVALPASGDAVT